MAQKILKQAYYDFMISNNFLFADLIKLFDKNHQTVRRYIKEKSVLINNIEVLQLLNKHLKEEGRGITDLNELFETEISEA